MLANESVKDCGSRRILVVDDEQALLTAMSRLLRSQGYQVETALGGRIALQSVHARRVDLVVADVMMPDIDGIELCASIRKVYVSPVMPVICMSGLSDRESRVRAKEAGADDYLVKPVDSFELLVRIENLFRAQACHEHAAQQERLLTVKLKDATEQLLRLELSSTRGSLAAGVAHELAGLAVTLRESLASLQVAITAGGPPGARALRQLEGAAEQLDQHARRLRHLGPSATHAPMESVYSQHDDSRLGDPR